MSSESHFLLVPFLYPHIVIAPPEVYFNKYSFIAHRVYQVRNQWQRIVVLDCLLIEPSIVYNYVLLSILLTYKEHWQCYDSL